MTFEKGYFVIPQLPEKLERAEKDRWEPAPDGHQWRTTDLRAAMRFSQDADDKASIELSRHRIRHYPFPSQPLPEFSRLDPHQREGVRWILTRNRAYLAHAPGAGKTIEAIVAANRVGGDVLVTCPPVLVENWLREIGRWSHRDSQAFPLREWLIETEQNTFDNAAFTWVVCPDTMLARREVLERLAHHGFSMLVVDEASRFKESTAQRTRALFGGKLPWGRSPGLLEGKRHVVFLDGSPMPNRPLELWAPTAAVAPEAIDFMDEREFGFRYCGPRLNDFGRYEFRGSTQSREPELRQKLTRDFMHVVEEKELSHPERRRRIYYLDDVRTLRMKRWEKRKLHPAMKLEHEGQAVGEFAHHRQELGVRKVDRTAEYAATRIESGEQVLIFFWHREVGHQLVSRLRAFEERPICHVDGQTPMALRNQHFDLFQRGRAPVLVGQVLAMGRGVNLQKADRIIFAEFSWSDETNKQAEKRASRRGSLRKQIPCDYMCCPNSLDELVLNTLFRKQKLVERLIQKERQ